MQHHTSGYKWYSPHNAQIVVLTTYNSKISLATLKFNHLQYNSHSLRTRPECVGKDSVMWGGVGGGGPGNHIQMGCVSTRHHTPLFSRIVLPTIFPSMDHCFNFCKIVQASTFSSCSQTLLKGPCESYKLCRDEICKQRRASYNSYMKHQERRKPYTRGLLGLAQQHTPIVIVRSWQQVHQRIENQICVSRPKVHVNTGVTEGCSRGRKGSRSLSPSGRIVNCFSKSWWCSMWPQVRCRFSTFVSCQVRVLRLHEVAAFMGKHQHPLQACDPPRQFVWWEVRPSVRRLKQVAPHLKRQSPICASDKSISNSSGKEML